MTAATRADIAIGEAIVARAPCGRMAPGSRRKLECLIGDAIAAERSRCAAVARDSNAPWYPACCAGMISNAIAEAIEAQS